MKSLPGGWLFRRLTSRVWVLKRIVRALKWFLPMAQDVVRGDYRPVPWWAFGYMLLALGYIVLPIDLIPDVFLLIGLVDDVVIVGWLLNRIDQQLVNYRLWKQGPDEDQATSSTTP